MMYFDYWYRKSSNKNSFEFVYSYKGNIEHKRGEFHKRQLASTNRKNVAKKLLNEGQTPRQIIEDSVRGEGYEHQLKGGNLSAR